MSNKFFTSSKRSKGHCRRRYIIIPSHLQAPSGPHEIIPCLLRVEAVRSMPRLLNPLQPHGRVRGINKKKKLLETTRFSPSIERTKTIQKRMRSRNQWRRASCTVCTRRPTLNFRFRDSCAKRRLCAKRRKTKGAASTPQRIYLLLTRL
jgi:hypothetical protein